MSSRARPSFGQRVYHFLFTIMGPADVKSAGLPAVKNPNDKTVPLGHHLETVNRRIALPTSDQKPG